jgi:hypothetical protein
MKGVISMIILKITVMLKALLQAVLHNVRVEFRSNVDGWNKLDYLVNYLLQSIVRMSDHQNIDEKYHYVAQFVELNDINHKHKGTLIGSRSANQHLFNTAKWRDVNVRDYLLTDVEELVNSFKGSWFVVNRDSPYYRHTINLNDDSAVNKAIAAAAVQLLTESKGKDPIRALDVLEVSKGNGALKDYDYISGELWIMCKQRARDSRGVAFISPFVINLKNGKVATGSTYTVEVEDRTRDLDLIPISEPEPDLQYELER